MRVLSQKRNYSVDFDRAVFWTQSNVVYAKAGNDNHVIGAYESEERARAVFESMHNISMINSNYIFNMPKT